MSYDEKTLIFTGHNGDGPDAPLRGEIHGDGASWYAQEDVARPVARHFGKRVRQSRNPLWWYVPGLTLEKLLHAGFVLLEAD